MCVKKFQELTGAPLRVEGMWTGARVVSTSSSTGGNTGLQATPSRGKPFDPNLPPFPPSTNLTQPPIDNAREKRHGIKVAIPLTSVMDRIVFAGSIYSYY